MPLGEGSYLLQANNDGTGQIKMNTRGTALEYDHPLVTYLHPERVCCSGWYTWFSSQVNSNNFFDELDTPPVLRIPSSYSTQKTWMTTQLLKASDPVVMKLGAKLGSLTAALEEYAPMYPIEDLEREFSTLPD
jgi:hypothetical protein